MGKHPFVKVEPPKKPVKPKPPGRITHLGRRLRVVSQHRINQINSHLGRKLRRKLAGGGKDYVR